MGMSEVAGQIQKGVRLFIASEGDTPNESWPYESILTALRRQPSMTPDELSRTVVAHYVAYYAVLQKDLPERFTMPVALSVLDLDPEKYEPFVAAVRHLGEKLMNNLGNEFINFLARMSLRESLSFFGASHIDLYDFCDRLERILLKGMKQVEVDPDLGAFFASQDGDFVVREILDACDAVKRVIDEGKFVPHWGFFGRPFARSRGVSIFFPVIARGYARLLFARDTGWDDLLSAFNRTSFERDEPAVEGSPDLEIVKDQESQYRSAV
jgi:hypothetical protein